MRLDDAHENRCREDGDGGEGHDTSHDRQHDKGANRAHRRREGAGIGSKSEMREP